MTPKRLAGLTVSALAAFAVLVGLGFWQLNRLELKEALIARIEARSKSDPITLDEATELAREGRDPSYYRVRVAGRLHHGRERHLFAASEGQIGWHVVTPLETADGEMVLIDRGFVPDALKDPASRAQGQIEAVVAITGIVRMPENQGMFLPDNDLDANRWFWRDLQSMARAMFPSGTIEVAPFFLEAEASEVPGGWPKGGQTRLHIVNNHLQYAVTWFLLAACLIVIYAALVWSLVSGRVRSK